MNARSLLVLFAALIALAFVASPAHSQTATCDIKSVNIVDAVSLVLFSDNNLNGVDFTNTIATAPAPTGEFTHTMLKPTALGNLTISLNNVELSFKPATNLLPVSLPSLRTACGQTNKVTVRSQHAVLRVNRLSSCDYYYSFTISNPSCSNVRGDPQFAGLRGQSFQVHGIDGAVYSLISAPKYAVNARFEFLTGPRPCPVMPSTGKKSIACWSHPGSYLSSVGLLTSDNENLVIEAGAADAGFTHVLLNGRELPVDEAVAFTGVSGFVVRNNTHELTLNVGVFEIVIENNDGFVNLRTVRVSADNWKELETQHVHGLLGQTWQARRYAGSVKEIEGEVDDYVIAEDSVIGHEFVYDRFRLDA